MKFKALTSRALIASVACALSALFLVAVPAEAATAPTLRVSTDPDRTAARDLNGSTLSGDAYVFLSGTDVSSVTFTRGFVGWLPHPLGRAVGAVRPGAHRE